MLSRTGSRLIGYLLLLFPLLYFCFQVYNYLYSPYKTTAAYLYARSDSYRTTGFAIRNETLIPDAGGASLLHYACEDGAKVLAGDVLAHRYANEAALALQAQLAVTAKEIEVLREASRTQAGQFSSTAALTRQIRMEQGAILDACYSGVTQNIDEMRRSLLLAVCKMQLAVGEETDFSQRLALLSAQYDALLRESEAPVATLSSPSTGYFVSGVDGYEQLYSVQNIDTLTVSELQRGIHRQIEPPANNGIGRLVSDYNWYLALDVPKTQIASFAVGDRVQVDFGLSGLSELPMRVDRILPPDPQNKNDNSIVLLHCNYVNSQLIAIRHCTVTVSFGTFRGLRVPTQAVRYQDDKPGVYVLVGNRVRFKSIRILYEDALCVICALSPDQPDQLALFDAVIAEGVDLYDGKIIR